MICLVSLCSLTTNICSNPCYFLSHFRSKTLFPQDSSSLEKENAVDEGNVCWTALPCFSSWEGKEREIKFNEHFYYVPGALHMFFHFNSPNNTGRYSGHILCMSNERLREVKQRVQSTPRLSGRTGSEPFSLCSQGLYSAMP